MMVAFWSFLPFLLYGRLVTSMARLTTRQREFLRALIALWQTHDAAVHYTELAEHIGVSRFSAYDMLRLLEGKGLVQSSYVLEHTTQITGRTSVFYSPTPVGLSEADYPAVEPRGDDWRSFRDGLLGQLRDQGEAGGYHRLLDELTAQLPDAASPLIYCSQVITALLINLDEARQKISGLNPLDALRSLTLPGGQSELGLLAGLSLGIGASGAADRGGSGGRLLDSIRRYQELLRDMGEDSIKTLSDFLQEALETVVGTQREEQAGIPGGSL
jgi:energy-coupling factor transport system substrate-specific component